jgi:nucleoside-diphosphate-sugar epimerase
VTRRVAVTGANGFIGRHLTAALAARGDTPIAIARPFHTPALVDLFHGVDTVVHLAGLVSALHAQDFFTANVDGTRAVAEAAAASGARMIHVSSLAAAGPAPSSAPRSEDDAPAPITPYGRSKLEGERVVLATPGLKSAILRPGAVYGPGTNALLPLFRAAALGILPLVGRAGAAYTFIHVGDLVRAITAAIDSDVSGALFVGHARPVTTRGLLEAVRDASGGTAAIVRVPLAITRVAAACGDLAGLITGHVSAINRWRYAELAADGFVCRVDRLRDQLGIVAQVEIGDGIAEMGRWYRSEGRLGKRDARDAER